MKVPPSKARKPTRKQLEEALKLAQDKWQTDHDYWFDCNQNLKLILADRDALIKRLQNEPGKVRHEANTKLILAVGQMLAMVTDSLRDTA